MHIEIDQSGRIENLTQDSVLAFSNEIKFSIFIDRREKRKCYQILKERYQIAKNLVLKIFAASIFLLIRDYLDKLDGVIIDIEYPGREGDIKGMLLRQIWKIQPDFAKDKIDFLFLGKKSKAHFIAYGVYQEKIKPDREIKASEILSLL